MAVWNFLISNVFRNPPVLLGIIACIGLIMQRKNIGDIIKGTFLTAFGMVILDTGVGMLVNSIVPINNAFATLTAGGAVEGLNDVTFTTQYGGEVGIAMALALVLHLLIARFTPFKVIFLTGHMIWWFPFIFIAAGVEAGLSGAMLIGLSAVFSALYWSIMPWLCRKYMFAVTGDESFTLGHPAGTQVLISGFLASKLGNKEKSTEDLKLPKSLSFFREISITGGIVVLMIFVVVSIIIPGAVPEGKNLVMYALSQGLMFGAGLTIMLTGVRLLISQIVPAFKGISEKLVPNAIPALDCPVFFNYKPNAVLIGFLVAMVTSTILLLVCNAMGVFNIIIIPLVITSFFECGTAAVVGEGQGGIRGCIIGTVAAATLMIITVGISAAVYSTTIQNWMLIFGGNDFSIFGPIAKVVASIF